MPWNHIFDELVEKYGLDVQKFSLAMATKLMTAKNQAKGVSWRDMTLEELLGGVDFLDDNDIGSTYGVLGESYELMQAIEHLSAEDVQDECLDVAGFALMIWQKLEDEKVRQADT